MANKKKVRILSLDGGGIRGIIPATVMQYVEEYLQKRAPGTTIADHFDLIAGTSTGGILAGIYLAPNETDKSKAKFSAADALNFYVKEGYSIFNASKMPNWKRLWGLRNATAYMPTNLENLLKKNFGELLISDMIKPCLITTYNMKEKSSFFFTRDEDMSKRKFLMRDVLRSTSAAPTYFPPAKIKNKAVHGESSNMINIDGGVFANNPTMCAYAEARNTNFTERNNKEPNASDMYILSIGTGGGGFQLRGKEQSNRWNLLKWAKAIPEIMMDGSVDTVAFQMNEIKETLGQGVEGDYHRVSVPNRPDTKDRDYSSDMSDASPENIKKLQIAGENTLKVAISEGLNDFLDGLLT